MGILVYSLLWVMQDLYHQPQDPYPFTTARVHRGWSAGSPTDSKYKAIINSPEYNLYYYPKPKYLFLSTSLRRGAPMRGCVGFDKRPGTRKPAVCRVAHKQTLAHKHV